MSPGTSDTIAALATARGASALAVVRVSGAEAARFASRCFGPADLSQAAGRSVHVGHLVSAVGERIDEVVATVFRAPASATGEDVVEFSCHGGSVVPGRVLETILAAGARMARAGEFTQRAFVNGKLDLAQAEAVADLIHAHTLQAQKLAARQLAGGFSRMLGGLREELVELAGAIELSLDFSDSDQDFADAKRLRARVETARATVSGFLGSARSGELVRDGVRVVIAGRPNAGKSTLLNALVGHDRAIVSETPGTTRDLVEADVELDGFLFRLVDTAGLRDADDVVESEGVRRARTAMGAADMVLYVYDAAVGLDEAEEAWLRLDGTHAPSVLVANKVDRAEAGRIDRRAVAISARRAVVEPRELEPLFERVVSEAAPLLRDAVSSPVLMNARHRAHLERTRDALDRVSDGLLGRVPWDLVAVDVRTALHELGCITGAITSEDVLDAVFSRFCIGK